MITPEPERGLVTFVGPSGLFYVDAIGSSGVASAGQIWGSLSSAAHRWALKLLDNKEVLTLLFSDDTLLLGESEISEEPFFFINNIFLLILGYPSREENHGRRMTYYG